VFELVASPSELFSERCCTTLSVIASALLWTSTHTERTGMAGFLPTSAYEQLCAALPPCFNIAGGMQGGSKPRRVEESAPVVEMGFATYAGDRYGTLNQDWCTACQVRPNIHIGPTLAPSSWFEQPHWTPGVWSA
jgi:hypothetical protein